LPRPATAPFFRNTIWSKRPTDSAVFRSFDPETEQNGHWRSNVLWPNDFWEKNSLNKTSIGLTNVAILTDTSAGVLPKTQFPD
jgi:hypothetical protein